MSQTLPRWSSVSVQPRAGPASGSLSSEADSQRADATQDAGVNAALRPGLFHPGDLSEQRVQYRPHLQTSQAVSQAEVRPMGEGGVAVTLFIQRRQSQLALPDKKKDTSPRRSRPLRWRFPCSPDPQSVAPLPPALHHRCTDGLPSASPVPESQAATGGYPHKHAGQRPTRRQSC